MRVLLSLILCLFAVTPALAAPAGTAKGKFTVNDVTAEIRHAVAVPWTNKDDGRQGVKVLLSDVPIPDDAVSRDGEGFDPGDKPGQVHAIEYILYPEEGADSGTLYHPGLKNYTLSTSGKAQFTSEVLDANTVAGRLYMHEPDDYFDRVYYYDLTFRAPISRALDAAGGAPAGTAQGTWTVNDQTAALRYAYAVARRDSEDDPEKMYVVLSEKAIPADKLLEEMGLRELERAGNFRALEFQLDPKEGIESNQLYHDALERGSFSSSGSSHKWLPRVFDKKTVAGRLFMTKPDDFFERVYYYSVAFRADVIRKPPPTFTGAAAASSPPGQAVIAFMRAARLKDKPAMKKLITPEMAADLEGPQGDQMLGFLSSMFAPASKVVAVYQTGESAQVVVMARAKGGKSTQKIPVKLIEGKWTLAKE